MPSQSSPQFALLTLTDCVRPDPHDPGPVRLEPPHFAWLKEKVFASLRSVVAPGALSEETRAGGVLHHVVEQLVEAFHVLGMRIL